MVEEARPSIPSTGKRRLSPHGRQTVIQIVVGLIILICGVIIGSGVAVLRLKDEMVMRPGPRPPTREVVEEMQARYDLTEEQTKQVEAAFEKRRETVQSIFEEFRTKSEAEFKTLDTEIKKILTAEQYNRWVQDFKRRRRPGRPWERGQGRPGDRGPGRRGGPGDRGPDDRRPGDRGPDDRGPGRDFGDRGPRGFHDRPGRDFRERDRGPWDPNVSGPNIPEPNTPTEKTALQQTQNGPSD